MDRRTNKMKKMDRWMNKMKKDGQMDEWMSWLDSVVFSFTIKSTSFSNFYFSYSLIN